MPQMRIGDTAAIRGWGLENTVNIGGKQFDLVVKGAASFLEQKKYGILAACFNALSVQYGLGVQLQGGLSNGVLIFFGCNLGHIWWKNGN